MPARRPRQDMADYFSQGYSFTTTVPERSYSQRDNHHANKYNTAHHAHDEGHTPFPSFPPPPIDDDGTPTPSPPGSGSRPSTPTGSSLLHAYTSHLRHSLRAEIRAELKDEAARAAREAVGAQHALLLAKSQASSWQQRMGSETRWEVRVGVDGNDEIVAVPLARRKIIDITMEIVRRVMAREDQDEDSRDPAGTNDSPRDDGDDYVDDRDDQTHDDDEYPKGSAGKKSKKKMLKAQARAIREAYAPVARAELECCEIRDKKDQADWTSHILRGLTFLASGSANAANGTTAVDRSGNIRAVS